MIKKGMPVLLAVAIFILASCSTASPQNSYASHVAPAVEQLAKWQAHYADFETLLTGPIAPANGMSRLDMIELYNMATEYKITREDYGSMGFLPLDALVGDANKLRTRRAARSAHRHAHVGTS